MNEVPDRVKDEPIKPVYTADVDMSMRARQLVSTVKQGRKITISILDEEQVTGYLCGWDEDTYFVLMPKYEGSPTKMLIPKSSILFIRLHDEQTFREERDYELMNPIVKRFKDHLTSVYFRKPS